MSKEEFLLTYWRELPPETQDQVLETFRSLQPDQDNPNELGPEHLTIRSSEHLNELHPINTLTYVNGLSKDSDRI